MTDEHLSADLIRHALNDAASVVVAELLIFDTVESTNTTLLERAAPAPGKVDVAIADHQSVGRGRNGRDWLMPSGGGLCLSMSTMADGLQDNSASISLALGIATIRALKDCGVSGVKLKWPNDLVVSGHKLGGLLLEAQSGGTDSGKLVAGVGINLRLDEQFKKTIEPGWSLGPVDIAALAETVPSRNSLTAALINQWLRAFATFRESGLSEFVSDLRKTDWLLGHSIRCVIDNNDVSGVAEGLAKDGSLLLRSDGELMRVVSGQVLVDDLEAPPAKHSS